MSRNRATWVLFLLGALSLPSPAVAQVGAVPQQLSLDEALRIARGNNPSYLVRLNDGEAADWAIKSAYGAFVPSLSASGGLSWQGSGDQSFGAFTAEQLGFADQPSIYGSSYGLSASVRIDGSVLMAPGQAKLQRSQIDAEIRAAVVTLDQTVTQQYLEVLRQAEEVVVADQELARAQFNLRLATAQRDVGTVTPLDVQQASVQVGRAEVTQLRARNAERTARLRLLASMGVGLGSPVELTTQFELTEPTFDAASLYSVALAENPSIDVSRHSRQASDYQVSVAKSSYWPSLTLNAGISGFTRETSNTDLSLAQAQAGVAGQVANCEFQNELYSRLVDPLPSEDCTRFVFSDAARNRIISSNDVFPFGFNTSPPSASLSVNVPIFQGLSRQQRVEAAQATRTDADYQLRELELVLEANVSINVGEVQTAYQSALIEERNQAFADEQLRLALERYRVGAISFVDLVESETVKAQADRARIAAIYSYHDAITNLEATVGVPIRQPGGTP